MGLFVKGLQFVRRLILYPILVLVPRLRLLRTTLVYILQQQDPMNASHLSFHIQSTSPTSPTASSLTTEQRRARERQQQQQQQPRFMLSRRRVETVTGVSGSPTSTSNSTATSMNLTPNQRAMVQAQLNHQEVPPNVVMPVTAGGGHHHHHDHHNILRNHYQAQTQTQAGSSSSSVVGDWSMGSPVHTPLSSSSSSSSSAAAALLHWSLVLNLDHRRHHREGIIGWRTR
jgi:hypothetical protein